jgi:hypothetical protein
MEGVEYKGRNSRGALAAIVLLQQIKENFR